MYGDCQVMKSMGGNVVPSTETLFSSSSSSIQNPNFNFMPFQSLMSSMVPKEENGQLIGGKEGIESGSGSEQVEEKSVNEQEINDQQQPPKKMRYHRHTVRQIQEMEALFKECPHPDDKQRLKLSQDLGLKPRQVKFWFQNRRTQMKAQQDRSDNAILRAENDSLKNENYRLQAALRNVMCPNCGAPSIIGDIGLDDQHQIRLENARLREELDQVCCLTSRYSTGRAMEAAVGPVTQSLLMSPSLDLDMNIYSRNFGGADPMGTCTEMVTVPMLLNPDQTNNCGHYPDHQENNGGLGILLEEEKSIAIQLAMSSMDELLKMCQVTEPLWIIDQNGGKGMLNVEEHARMFPWVLNCLKEFPSESRIEATRDSAVVIMNSITLVDAFLDAEKWMDLFPTIVSKARTIQVISSDHSGQSISGSLQLMYAELQVLSPLVPTREAHFLRYCQQSNAEEGTWVIVDYPIDSFVNYENLLEYNSSFPKYKRRPSGCVIQDMPNGYSRVTWVEHAHIENKPIHQTFTHFVSSGMAFGAHRWLAVLQTQCERLASLMARNISDLGVIPSPEARKNLMKLAQRMIRTFSVNMSSSGGQSWTALSDSPEDTVRITTRKSTESGQPNGVILIAVSTTWLPYSHFQVFDLLRDERRRTQLDVLSNGNSLHEVAHIANGSHPGNCISLLRINVASNSSQNVELMLQESSTGKSGSLVVYTTMDVDSIQLVMNGQDPSSIPLLPIGFVIAPVVESSSTTPDSISSLVPSSEDNIGNSESTTNRNTTSNGSGQLGCLLTVGLQVLASTIPSAKLNLSSVTAINNHLCNTVHQIASSLRTTMSTSITNNNASSFENINGNLGGSNFTDPNATTPSL